jgi:hypothetical protein
MGAAELDVHSRIITIHSHFVFYGGAATPQLAEQLRDEVETLWNEPKAQVEIGRQLYTPQFRISAQLAPALQDIDIYQNTDPRNNYFRIETFAATNISFVDGLGCNSGYFLLENLYAGSTTAAHEYGHTLGLDHPEELDIRGKATPGIMYPRGTLVDPQFQYDPSVPAGQKGGTLHPMHRRVLPADIRSLRLHRLRWQGSTAVVGDFTNVYHDNHASHQLG